VEQHPPIWELRSLTETEMPARASVIAAERPFGPDPMIAADGMKKYP
jgi:hypothetical protein